MARASTTWRTGDSIAFSQMRSAYVQLEALLLRLARSSTEDVGAIDELQRTRETVLALDGFDRGAVRRQAIAIKARVDELRTTVS